MGTIRIKNVLDAPHELAVLAPGPAPKPVRGKRHVAQVGQSGPHLQ
jgi:hypothetical protein